MAVKRGGKLGTRTSAITTLPSHPPHIWNPSVTNLPESRGSEETLQSDDSLHSDGWGNLYAGRPLQTDGDAAPPVECDPAVSGCSLRPRQLLLGLWSGGWPATMWEQALDPRHPSCAADRIHNARCQPACWRRRLRTPLHSFLHCRQRRR
jgi:hypothetical protein